MKDVDAYIKSTPKKAQPMLREIRKIIKSAAPKAEEKISYGMPYYGYCGRLAYFRLAKNHLGLYIPPPIIAEHNKELNGYSTTISAVHLPLDKKLPASLIKNWLRRG